MMIPAAIVALIASIASASFVPNSDVPADSALGARLLRKATVIEPARHLEQERDVSFVGKYSIRYLGCASIIQFAERHNVYGGMLYTKHLVRFALCPTDSCSKCTHGGEYVVDMNEFVDSYTEFKLNEQEYICEMIRENCYCDNANDDQVCEYQCYVDTGHEECIEYEGREEFEIQRYLECQKMEMTNNNNDNQLFVGPYCASNGKSIRLGVFRDETCTSSAKNGLETWKTHNYGQELPYSSGSIITHGECIDCKAVDENANQNQDIEIIALCEQSYEMAVRCEER